MSIIKKKTLSIHFIDKYTYLYSKMLTSKVLNLSNQKNKLFINVSSKEIITNMEYEIKRGSK